MFLVPISPNLNKMKSDLHRTFSIGSFLMILQGQPDQQRHARLGQRPTVVGQRPTTDILNSAEFGCSEENKVAQEGILSLLARVQTQSSVTCPPHGIWPCSPTGARIFGSVADKHSSHWKRDCTSLEYVGLKILLICTHAIIVILLYLEVYIH